jgi:hypothetical protein
LPAAADDLSRFSTHEENESLWFKSDQHYTQGLRASITTSLASPDSEISFTISAAWLFR